MSSPSAGPARRRRIAGERRGPGTPGPDPSSATATPEPTTPEPTTPGPTTSPAPRRRRLTVRRGRRPGRLVLGLTGLLVLLLLYSGLLLLGWLGNDGLADVSRAEDEASAARTAQASAERAADAVLAYDYRSLDSDRDAATRFMTEEYAEQYVATFDTAVAEAAEDTQAQVAVEVQASAVISADTDEAKILLFVDQTTLRSDSDQPRQALNRAEFQMVRQGDSWLVDDILSF
jgi:Mce-associated membrane protein